MSRTRENQSAGRFRFLWRTLSACRRGHSCPRFWSLVDRSNAARAAFGAPWACATRKRPRRFHGRGREFESHQVHQTHPLHTARVTATRGFKRIPDHPYTRSKEGPNTVQKSVFHRCSRGMDRTAFPPLPIALIPRLVGMHGGHGKRFDARVPLGRHFALSSRYKGHFPSHGHHW
jgi:hypothetical protein